MKCKFVSLQFLQFMESSDSVDVVVQSENTSSLGLAMTILGTTLLIFAATEYVLFLRRICREADRKFPFTTTLFAADLLSLVGLLVLLEMLFQIGPF